MTHIPFLLEFFTWSALAFFLFVFLQGPFFTLLQRVEFFKQIRSKTVDGKVASIFSKMHAKKSGTPTGAGILIFVVVALVIAFSRTLSFFGFLEQSLLQRTEVYLPLFTLVVVGILGAIDDWWNVKGIGKDKGIAAGPKFVLLIFFALLAGIWFQFKLDFTEIEIPFWGALDLGILFFPFLILVIVGTANAVNITDGLDGLAGGLLVQNFLVFAALAFVRGQFFLAIFCGIVTATLLAFLWFNALPAKFFMGDAGSLGLGATLAVIAAMTGTLAILPVVGLVFVFETLSVIAQLFSKKFFKRKIFHVAPIHHHFEKIGWSETQIVVRFWLIGGLCCIAGFLMELTGNPNF